MLIKNTFYFTEIKKEDVICDYHDCGIYDCGTMFKLITIACLPSSG